MASAVSVLVVAVDRTAARAQAAYINRLPGFRTVATVGSAAAGLRRLSKGDVDLVLLDRMLPDGDGADLAARLAEQGFRGDVILTCSADDGWLTGDHVTPPGAVGELIRPFTFDCFRQTLLAWVAGRALSAEGGITADSTDRTGLDIVGKDERVSARRFRAGRTGLPLGLRPDTLDAITVVLRDRYRETSAGAGEPAGVEEPAGLTVSFVATAVGASRVTVRRYLEYLAEAGVLARSLRERTVGRPEPLYRPIPRHV
ncbi:MAG: response regulator [Nakamurella sp.]